MDFLKREWEIISLAAVLSALLLWGLLHVLDNDDDSEDIVKSTGRTAEQGELITPSGKAFLSPATSSPALATSRPFALPGALTAPVEPPKTPPKPTAQPQPAPAPIVQNTPAAPAPKPAEPAPVQTPAPPPEPKYCVGRLFYSTAQELSDGTRVAFMELNANGQRQTIALGKGESQQGITIVNVTLDTVYLLDAKKRRVALKRNGEQQLWLLDELP